jgi:hypothetical protein
MTDELTVEEYQEVICEPVLTYEQWKMLADQCERTKEAEADFSRPAGEHYNLMMAIRKSGLAYVGDKCLMTRWVDKVLNNGYKTN